MQLTALCLRQKRKLAKTSLPVRQVLLSMKLTAILILFACLHIQAKVLSQSVTLSVKNAPLRYVLKEIKKQMGYNLLYTSEAINEVGNITLEVKNTPVADALQKCFANSNLTFSIIEKTIVVKQKQVVNNQPAVPPPPQNINITGKIIDDEGQPLKGATVQLKGGIEATTTTNDNGEFVLDIPDNSSKILVISFVGMETKEINVANQKNIAVRLFKKTVQQQDIVVIGYGSQKKVNLTGSVVSIGAKQIENRSVSDIAGILNGQAPGLTVIQNGGNPGQNSGALNVRGIGTLNSGTAPLVILDGVPIEAITNINPQDIENISILKDAASSSIYGVRAANGVILITTKRGKAGKMKVDFGHQSGLTSFISLPEKVNAVELARLHNILTANDGATKKFSNQDIQKFASGSDANYPNHNMLDDVLKNGVWNAHNLALSGGSDKTTYNVSLGYIGEGGIIDNTNLKKYTMRTNLDFKVSEKINLGLNLSATSNQVNTPAAGVTNIISLAYYSWANDLYQYPDGRWAAPYWSGQEFNAKAYNSSEMGYNKLEDFNWMATFFAEYKPIKDLKIRGSITTLQDYNKGASIIRGIDMYVFDPVTGNIGAKAFATSMYQRQSPLVNIVNRNTFNNREMTYQLTANYLKAFGKHTVGVLAGMEKRKKTSEYTSLSRKNLLSDVLTAINAADPTTAQNAGASTEFGLISTFGRVNYNFDERYLLEGNLRYDGSSRFAQDMRYQLFPSVSAGWRISKEKFFKVPVISDLKLRASYGSLGNQEVGDYRYLQTYILSGSYFFNNTQQAAIIESSLANAKLKWEKTNMKNIGLDAGLLNNQLTFSADYFVKNTNDILLAIPQPAILGAAGPVLNAGAVKNSGYEFTIGYTGRAKKVNYYVRANFSKIKNEITDLAGTDAPGRRIGDPISNIFGYKAIGLFQSTQDIGSSPDQSSIATSHPGDIKYADISGPNGVPDGKITDLDRTNLGHAFPGINYGISLGANYKGFDVSMVWQGIGDVQFLASGKAIQPFLFNSSPLQFQTDVWTTDNKSAAYPRITSNSAYYQASSFWLRSAAYLKLRNAQLGYTLSVKTVSKIKLSKVRFYLSGENLLTVKGFTFGYDPEQFYGQGDPVSFFGSNRTYPTTRRFLLGVNVSF